MRKPSLRHNRLGRLCACAGFALLLAACQPTQPPLASVAANWTDPADAAQVYVILPESYRRYLAEDLIFASNGAPEDLPVYPTAEEAVQALRAFETQAVHARYVWRVFQLKADWNKDVIALGNEYRLSGPARVAAVVAD